MAGGGFEHGLERLPVGDRAGRVVGVDQHQGAGAGVGQAGDLLGVGLPAVRLVQVVMDGAHVELGEDGGVEGVARAGHEHPFAGLEEGGEQRLDRLRGAVADDDLAHAADPLALLGVAADRLARLGEPLGGGVGVLVVAQRAHDRLDHHLRGAEVELTGVADVQADQPLAHGLGLAGVEHDVAHGVGHAVDAARGADRRGARFHGSVSDGLGDDLTTPRCRGAPGGRSPPPRRRSPRRRARRGCPRAAPSCAAR